MALGHFLGALTISVVTALGLCEKRSLDILKLGTLKETQPRGKLIPTGLPLPVHPKTEVKTCPCRFMFKNIAIGSL